MVQGALVVLEVLELVLVLEVRIVEMEIQVKVAHQVMGVMVARAVLVELVEPEQDLLFAFRIQEQIQHLQTLPLLLT